MGRHKRSAHSTNAQDTRNKTREEQMHKALIGNGFIFERKLRTEFRRRAEHPYSARVCFVAVLRAWGPCVFGGG